MTSAYAQSTTTAPTTGAPPQPGPLGMILPFALMFAVIYFLIIRPQQKKLKEHQSLLDKVQHGDEVLTSSGIFGKVVGITDKVLTVDLGDGVKVKMLKSAVATVNPNLTPTKEK